MNIFLLEKKSSLNSHRPNLALARLSTVYKQRGDKVYHFVLDSKFKFPSDIKPDKVVISIVFSWDCEYFVKLVRKLRGIYGLTSDTIEIGGVCTLFMKDYIIAHTQIVPQVGCNKKLDMVVPDPSFYDNDSTYIFTMRGCENACSFCCVNELEKEHYVIENWKEQINLNAKHIVLCDNNLLSSSLSHKESVFSYLSEIANVKGTKIPGTRGKIREVSWDGGIDFRRITVQDLEMMKDIRFEKIKVAFDDIRYEKKFDEAMKLLLQYYPKVSSRGIHENIEAYVLYNCSMNKDTIEDALYRVYKLRYLYGAQVYLMRYQPLNTLKYKSYVSPYWNEKDCVDIARWANNKVVFMKVGMFKNYYGRKSDGKCLNATTENERNILSNIQNESLKIDFNKSFKENLKSITEELNQRKSVLSQLEEDFEQVMFL